MTEDRKPYWINNQTKAMVIAPAFYYPATHSWKLDDNDSAITNTEFVRQGYSVIKESYTTFTTLTQAYSKYWIAEWLLLSQKEPEPSETHPPLEHRGKLWHWILNRNAEPQPAFYYLSLWQVNDSTYSPAEFAKLGIKYLKPCEYELTTPLTFQQLREANIKRLPQFRNAQGALSHPPPHQDGSNWKLSGWSNAVAGEVGELCNMIKKLERGDFDPRKPLFIQGQIADELADVATYLDILAFRLDVDLGKAIASKFNRISERVESDVRLPEQD